MANLNLSEFTEKLFVADADHTFIWDSAMSISKRVSRNSWLNSGTLTSDAPVTISQTWNQIGTAFTAFKVNAVSTASASGSLLLDLQVGTVSQFNVRKNGQALFSSGIVSAPGITFLSGSNTGIWETSAGVQFSSAGTNAFGIRNEIRVNGSLAFGFASGTPADTGLDVALWRDSASGNTLALRNGAAAQTFNVYGTYTSGSVYERMFMRYNGTDLAFQVGAETLGATARPLQLWTGGASRLHITTAGNVGIGTTAPGSTLTVAGTFYFGSNNGALPGYASYGGNIGASRYFFITGTSVDNTTIYLQNNSSGSKNAMVRLLGSGSGADYGALQMLTIESSPIIFATNATEEKMRITAAGNVGIGTTSPTSKLHVVGDAVLTGQLLGSDYTVGTVATATQANVAITNNHTGQTNSSVVITPKGTGAFILGPKPDGTAVGGNARGNYAVDHQLDRTAATDVASGPNSCIGGGQRNVASGAYSVVAGGQVTTASGSNSFAGGGLGVTASGANSFAGCGQTNTASAGHSVVTGGQSNTASAAHSVVCGGFTNASSAPYAFTGGGINHVCNGYASTIAGGDTNTTPGGYSFVGGGRFNAAASDISFVSGGMYGRADRYGIGAHAAGRFALTGDAQITKAIFRNKTTTNSAVELFLDGTSIRYTVTSGKIISMLINITGTKSDGSAVAHYVRQYSIKNIGGTTSQVYAAVTVGTDNAAGTSIAISADDTNDSLKIEVTGVAAETWRWVASVDAVEVGHGV